MRSRRSFLHLGLVVAATLSVSSASAVPAYFGSPRGGGTVTARDDTARTFTAARRGRAWTQSGHPDTLSQCPLLGVKRTSGYGASMSANDPKQTFAASNPVS